LSRAHGAASSFEIKGNVVRQPPFVTMPIRSTETRCRVNSRHTSIWQDRISLLGCFSTLVGILVRGDVRLVVRLWRDDRLDAGLPQVIANGVGRLRCRQGGLGWSVRQGEQLSEVLSSAASTRLRRKTTEATFGINKTASLPANAGCYAQRTCPCGGVPECRRRPSGPPAKSANGSAFESRGIDEDVLTAARLRQRPPFNDRGNS